MKIQVMELLEEFSTSVGGKEKKVTGDIRDYFTWLESYGQGGKLELVKDADELQAYLLHCRVKGKTGEETARINSSLKKFMGWLEENHHIENNPFDLSLIGNTLTDKNIYSKRHETFSGTPDEMEISRLQALNKLAERTNRAVDMKTMLQDVLRTLVEIMLLNTAWISLKTDTGLNREANGAEPSHGFFLAAGVNLPVSLEKDDRYFLKRPPACRCQQLLMTGNMKNGVNIVECSRLQEASASSGEQQTIRFHASVPIHINGRAAGMINIAARDWELLSASDLHFLTMCARQLEGALERALLNDQMQVQRDHLAREMAMARAVQVSMLPEEMPEFQGYELAHSWKPAMETSGDFYNVFKLHGGRWGFVIADVCDKGAAAALYMSLANGLFREQVDHELTPGGLLTKVNRSLVNQGIKSHFVTAFYGILEPEKGTLSYAIAGHPPPLLRKIHGEVVPLPGEGLAMGLFSDIHYENQALTFKKGESLVLFTDGLVDANNAKSEPYNLEQLKEAIATTPAAAQSQAEYLQERVSNWVGESPIVDDITMVIIHRKSQI
jgi:serine phosphatase RsbU (regulator of sigma subunit)